MPYLFQMYFTHIVTLKKIFSDIPAESLPRRPEINLEPVTAETFRLRKIHCRAGQNSLFAVDALP
jgi:hypothetical protein